jgi:hypothetical protein
MTKARTLADNFAADINGITAGTGITGGGTSGTVTVTNEMATAINAKGDLVGGTGADTFARLAVGTNGHVLTADSVETTGMKWAAPAAGGKVAQVLSTTKTDTFSASIASGASTAVTGISVTITPTSASSKILVLLQIHSNSGNHNGGAVAIANGSTLLNLGDSAGSRLRAGAAQSSADAGHLANMIIQYLDSPATTSAVTYNAYALNPDTSTRTVYVNRSETDTDSKPFIRAASNITVMEILP